MELTLEALGLSQTELQERVVASMCDALLTEKHYSNDGEYRIASTIRKQFDAQMLTLVNEQINAYLATHMAPGVKERIEYFVIQNTNQYGEKKGDPTTLTEYIIAKTNSYLEEKVDKNGKTSADGYSYDNNGPKTTRLAWLFRSMVDDEIKQAVQAALNAGMGVVGEGITGAIKATLAQFKDTYTLTQTIEEKRG